MLKAAGAECKGCSASVRVTDGEIDSLVASLNLRPGERAESEAYRNRLEACAECVHLRYGTTCMQCGCLVRVRALLASSRCPNPSGSLWP